VYRCLVHGVVNFAAGQSGASAGNATHSPARTAEAGIAPAAARTVGDAGRD
jgi:hypothetical protein